MIPRPLIIPFICRMYYFFVSTYIYQLMLNHVIDCFGAARKQEPKCHSFPCQRVQDLIQNADPSRLQMHTYDPYTILL